LPTCHTVKDRLADNTHVSSALRIHYRSGEQTPPWVKRDLILDHIFMSDDHTVRTDSRSLSQKLCLKVLVSGVRISHCRHLR
jgi:hypothetical protein